MKLRIGLLLATVAVIIAIIAFFHDWRGGSNGGGTATQPPVSGKASPGQSSAVPNGGAQSSAAPQPPLTVQDGGAKLPASPQVPVPAPASPRGTSTAVAPMPAGQRAAAPAAPPMPRPVPVVAGSPRARTSPGDPLAADAERKAGAIEAEKVTLMLRDYRTRLGENPVGTNAEIMKAVMGGNPKGAMFGPPEGQALNGNGELMDRWGTPYFFHQLSATSMEIRSAGPDREMYTEDDVITH